MNEVGNYAITMAQLRILPKGHDTAVNAGYSGTAIGGTLFDVQSRHQVQELGSPFVLIHS